MTDLQKADILAERLNAINDHLIYLGERMGFQELVDPVENALDGLYDVLISLYKSSVGESEND